jgi:hypothetical protein
VHRPPQAQVTAAEHDDRHVGHLHQRAPGGRGGGARVDDARHGAVAKRDGQGGAGLGRGRRGQQAGTGAPWDQRDPGCRLDGQPVEGVGWCLGPGGEPVGEAGDGVGCQAEDGGLVPVEVGQADAAVAGEHDRARGGEHRRTRTALR